MKIRALIFVSAVATTAATLLPAPTGAYLINPLRDRYAGGTGHRFFSHVRNLANIELDSVHEDITHAAEACVRGPGSKNPAGAEPICSPVVSERRAGEAGNLYNPLIRGNWWNDDPNQLLNSVHYATWYARMEDAEAIARRGRNLRGQRRQINPTYYMQYRSHFGDLQFLHAQANVDGERPGDTQQRILDWMEFAYAVAIEDIGPERTLGEIDLPIIRSHFQNQSGWTVGYLFEPRYRLTSGRFGDVALGSMLHAVQDSFAAGHNRRGYEPAEGCAHGRVIQFTSYLNQNSDRHAEEDTRAALQQNIEERFTRLHNPVEASARLILFVRQEADWDRVVEPYLKTNLFCIGPDAQASGPGGF